MSDNKALRSGIGYTIGNILIKGINFLTLPLFSRLLTPEEFGVYNVFVSYDAILFVLMGLALHTSIRSANLEFRGEIDRYASSVSLIYVINCGVIAGVAVLFWRQMSQLLALPPAAVVLLVLGSFSNAVIYLYNTRLSLDYSYKKYLLVSAGSSLSNILLSVTLILSVFRQDRAMGRIVGSVAPLFVIALLLLLSFYRKALPKFSKKYWKFGVSYSLPMVPHGISQVLLGQCDRIMIRSMVSDAAAGIYSLAGNIKLVLVIITDSVATAWTTWFYGQMDKGDTAAIRKRSVQLMGLFFIFTVGLMALAPELVLILGGAEYDMGKYIAIPLVIDAFIIFLYNVIVPSEYYVKKTVYIMAGTIISALVNVVLNYVFIGLYGYLAAAYTTLASYVLYLILHCIISRKLVGFFVLSPLWLIGACVGVGLLAVWNLWFVDSLLLRWGMCAVVVIPTGLLLLRAFMRDRQASRKE